MVRPLFAALIAIGCASPTTHSELAGVWELQVPENLKGVEMPVGMTPKWTLTLKADGTFTEHVENRVMMVFLSDGKGTYKKTGSRVKFQGSATYTMDDGYAKDSGTKPIDYDMSFENGALIQKDDGRGEDMVFRRAGDPVPPAKKPTVRLPDPKAIALLKEVEKRYAAMSSYSDEGTFESAGRGFLPKRSEFLTRFARPKKFRFEERRIDAGTAYVENVVWSDGKKSWLYMASVGGSAERGIANALSTISSTSGNHTMLLPSLLMPDEFKRDSLSSQFKEFTFGPPGKVEGRPCRVLELADPEGMNLKLWIDPSSGLILQAQDGLSDATITYSPRANPKLADKEFKFSPPE